MFKLIRLLINIAIFAIIVLVILYFLPNGLTRTILDTAENIVAKPSDSKTELVNQLEPNLKNLQDKVSSDPTVKKTKSANESQSPSDKEPTAIIKKTAEILAPEEKNPEEPPYSIQESKTP